MASATTGVAEARRPRGGAGYWAAVALSIILIGCGLWLVIGGMWLLTLGGSWYYFIAGIGVIATGVLIIRRQMAAFWVYLATWLFTLVWALWEVGLDGWAQVPRLLGPTIVLILVALTIPVLRRPSPEGEP